MVRNLRNERFPRGLNKNYDYLQLALLGLGSIKYLFRHHANGAQAEARAQLAGYRVTGQVTRERRKNPFQLARGAMKNS